MKDDYSEDFRKNPEKVKRGPVAPKGTKRKGWTRVNTNNYVRVELTPKGKEILDEYESDGYGPTGDRIESSDGIVYLKIQMWKLMLVFGPHCYNGCEVPFVDNKLLLKEDD